MDTIANRKKLKTHLVLITFIIYFLNTIASKFYWYTSIWWFDMLMHFIGGVWVAFILLWFFPIKTINFSYFIKIILGVLIVGLAWEAFELVVNGMYARNPIDVLDTISDIFFDMAGGVATILYFLKRIMLKDVSAV